MSSFLREHIGAASWSVALHAAVVAALAFGADFLRPAPTPQVLAIEAVVVDETLLARVAEQRDEAERQRLEAQRAQEEAERREREAEEQRRLAAEQAEREREAEEARQAEEARRQEEARQAEQRRQEEAERQAQLQRQQEEAQRRAEQEAAERERLAEEARQREEAERQRREEEARQARLREEEERRRREEEERLRREEEQRRQREAEERRLQAELEAELQREAERLAAVRSGAQDQYVAMLTSRIEQNWFRPPSARVGTKCTVHVRQIPSGEVISAQVTSCNGDDAVRRSIEDAVLRSSPLPLPLERSLFQRDLIIEFVPDE